MRSFTAVRSAVVVSLLLAASWSAAPTAAVEVSPSDPEAAKKVLAAWFDTLAQAQSLATEFDTKIDATAAGQSPRSETSGGRLAVARPNKFLLASTRGPGLAVVADDKQLYEYLASKKKYHVKDKPLASLAELNAAEVVNYANYGLGLGFVDGALRSASFDAFFALLTDSEYVGAETKGQPAHHIRVLYDSVPIDAWFKTDDAKLLRLAVADMKPTIKKLLDREPVVQAQRGAAPTAPKEPFPPEVTVAMTVTFKFWNFNGPVTATTFKIPPAPGAEKVYDIFAPPAHPLLGKQAPGFVTASLQGQPVSAAQLAGKVVVLDFWATWCPPCVASLPKITAATAQYRDKGVVFLAVNCGEDPPEILQFLQQQNLNAPVVLDQAGQIGKLYAVTGIPQTVIIDKKGMVHVVHVGAGANIGTQLARELDDILAGKDLLAEQLKK
jgi:thiol-disulfide isomerase/thioredoxin